MGRFLAGVAAALLLMTGVLFWWKGASRAADPVPAAPIAATPNLIRSGDSPLADPPRASERTREEKRFSRYDKDRDGTVARAEYLSSRQKAFAKLDIDRDGRLSFDEYSAKMIAKFGSADADRSGGLSASEFATTRVVRKQPAHRNCPPRTVEGDENEAGA